VLMSTGEGSPPSTLASLIDPLLVATHRSSDHPD
jgi:hypothetical protein